jgi:hypothetical protein
VSSGYTDFSGSGGFSFGIINEALDYIVCDERGLDSLLDNSFELGISPSIPSGSS